MANNAKSIKQQLLALSEPERAKSQLRFFKDNPANKGLADQFIGLSMPVIREQVKQYKPLALDVCIQLLKSPLHEVRIFALLSMVALFKARKPDNKEAVFKAYLQHTPYINNWDLVDCSCYHIVGPYLMGKDTTRLEKLAKSANIWERRIAMVSTYHNIKLKDFQPTLILADLLIGDKEDLIHKAVGWMLKEVGKRDNALLVEFLQSRYQNMPRTMLRTAIEKMDKQTRQAYLDSKV